MSNPNWDTFAYRQNYCAFCVIFWKYFCKGSLSWLFVILIKVLLPSCWRQRLGSLIPITDRLLLCKSICTVNKQKASVNSNVSFQPGRCIEWGAALFALVFFLCFRVRIVNFDLLVHLEYFNIWFLFCSFQMPQMISQSMKLRSSERIEWSEMSDWSAEELTWIR